MNNIDSIFQFFTFQYLFFLFFLSFQDLIDKAKTILVGNRSLLQRMQASTGIPVTDDSNDPSYTNFNQVGNQALIALFHFYELWSFEPKNICYLVIDHLLAYFHHLFCQLYVYKKVLGVLIFYFLMCR